MKDKNKPGLFGRLFNKLKTKLMGDFVVKNLASLLAKAKAKNPKIWGVIVAIAFGLQFGFNGLINTFINGIDFIAQAGIELQLPERFGSLQYILTQFNVNIPEQWTTALLMLLAAITNSNTTPFLPIDQRNKVVEDMKLTAAKVDKRRGVATPLTPTPPQNSGGSGKVK